VLYMKSDPTAYCTTFVDYYGLGSGFPAKDAIGEHDSPGDKKKKLEEAVFQDIQATLGKRHDTSHFIPYVQMYEFEGLLFSDEALCPGYNKEFQGNLAALEIGLAAIRSACPFFSEWIARLEGLGGCQ
jgi:hypothetical protein